MVSERLPAEVSSSGLTFDATALVATDQVKLQTNLVLPQHETSQAPNPAVPAFAALVLVPAIPASRKLTPKMRWISVLLIALVVLLLLTSCSFFLDFSGSTTGDIRITNLEYKGGQDSGTWTMDAAPSDTPIWAITAGTATYQVDLTLVSNSEGEGGSNIETSTCSGTITYNLTGGIFSNANVMIPDLSSN